MSTLNVNTINSATSGQAVAVDISNPRSFRNVLINGAMQVNQRGDAAATGSAGYLSADRWKTHNGSGAQVAVSRSTDAPDGFGYSTKWDCTTADTSLAGSDYLIIGQDIEGQDVQHFHKGKSTAKKFALQFWIKSTITGTYIVNLLDSDNGRLIAKAYTISSADTWEKKTMVFDADTTGALTNDNNKSLRVSFFLLAGSDYTSGTLATTWATEVSANKGVGQANAFSSTSNNVFITGVQLEAGSYVTDFEHRSYGEELHRCERYYQNSYLSGNAPASSTAANNSINLISWGDGNCQGFLFPRMRAAPSVVLRNPSSTTVGRLEAANGDKAAAAQDISDHQVRYISVTSGAATNWNSVCYELISEL